MDGDARDKWTQNKSEVERRKKMLENTVEALRQALRQAEDPVAVVASKGTGSTLDMHPESLIFGLFRPTKAPESLGIDPVRVPARFAPRPVQGDFLTSFSLEGRRGFWTLALCLSNPA